MDRTSPGSVRSTMYHTDGFIRAMAAACWSSDCHGILRWRRISARIVNSENKYLTIANDTPTQAPMNLTTSIHSGDDGRPYMAASTLRKRPRDRGRATAWSSSSPAHISSSQGSSNAKAMAMRPQLARYVGGLSLPGDRVSSAACRNETSSP